MLNQHPLREIAVAILLECLPLLFLGVGYLAAGLLLTFGSENSAAPLIVFALFSLGFAVSGVGWWCEDESRIAFFLLLARGALLIWFGYYLLEELGTSDCGGGPRGCQPVDNSAIEIPLFVAAFVTPLISSAVLACVLWRRRTGVLSSCSARA